MNNKWQYNIVVVDADLELRTTFIKTLGTQKGLSLHFFKNGIKALSFWETCQLSNYPIDIIISDWDMPKLTGKELFEIVSSQSNKPIPFILISANKPLEEVKEVIANGVSDYLVKPINQQRLLTKISTILKCPSIHKNNTKMGSMIDNLESLFSIGHKVIDKQHGEVIDNIRLLMDKELDRNKIIDILAMLGKYTQIHFNYEEKLMKSINYKDIEAHKLLHKTFYNEVVQMSKEFRNTSVQELNKELLQFLLFWFKDHILKEDFKYKIVLDTNIQ